MTGLRTIVAGSRSIADPGIVADAIAQCGWEFSEVVSGCARGVDSLGEDYANRHGIPVKPFPADWDSNPRAAGHIRNRQMAEYAEALVAVWDGSSVGTAGMIQEARRCGLRVHVHSTRAGPPPAPVPAPPAALGAQRTVGIGQSTVLADMDFETYCEAGFEWDAAARKWRGPEGAPGTSRGLTVVGTANYVQHPTFEILCFAYDLKDGLGRRRWYPSLPAPTDLFAYLQSGGLIEAWNAPFERWVWDEYCVKRLGWPEVPLGQWRCAMAKARAHSLPGALAKAGEVLGLTVQKDADGDRLLKKFSMPRNPTQADPRLRIKPMLRPLDVADAQTVLCPPGATPKQYRDARLLIEADAADGQRLLAYNETDIESEAEASSRIPDLSPTELMFWQDDQRINRRGVRVDMDAVHDCIVLINAAYRVYGEELAEITGGIAPSEVKQLLGWLHARGVHMDALDEDAVSDALRGAMPDDCRRVLQIRAAVASASVKKVFAIKNQATRAGRLHDLYMYHGARTGRPTGSGVQATNLAKYGPNVVKCPHCGHWHGDHTMWCGWCHSVTVRPPSDKGKEWHPDAMEDALRAISYRSLAYLELVFGDALLTISGVLRGLFIAADGHDLVSSDFTAIEGVVVACLAGEQWRVDAYASGSPMYLLSAERMFGTPVSEMEAYAKANGMHHPLRQKGKGGELGLGFGGWINALRQFDVDGSEDELKDLVLKWRAASPNLVWFWGGQTLGAANSVRGGDRWDRTPFYFGLEGAVVQAVQNPGMRYHVTRMDGSDTGIAYLVVDDVLYCRVPTGGVITYHRPRLQRAEQEWRGLSFSYEGWNTNPKSGPPGWVTLNGYGGKFCENVVQKVARDKQMVSINACERGGFPVVMHTYDEIVSEVPEGFGSVEDLEALMVTPQSWNAGWPLKAAGGWRAKRYRKG